MPRLANPIENSVVQINFQKKNKENTVVDDGGLLFSSVTGRPLIPAPLRSSKAFLLLRHRGLLKNI